MYIVIKSKIFYNFTILQIATLKNATCI